MKKAIPNLYKDLQFNYYRFTVLSSIFSILIVLISFHNLHSQSVYFCNAIDVRVRAENCDDNTSTIYGLVSNPQSYVVLNTQGSSCGGGLNWYEIDIPNAHGTSGYPNTAFVASNYFNISPNPSNYLTVQNSPNGLRVRNTRNGPFTYIINTGFLPNFASFENGQRLARTSTAPVLDGNGIDTWYEIFLTPNCYVNNTTSSGQKLTGWVSNGISIDGPYVVPFSQCTAPASQANNIGFPSVGSNSMLVNWANGTNNSRRVVYINTTNNFTAPVNGTDPSPNPNYLLGSGQQCVYNDNGNSVLITGLSCSTPYFFRVYEVNCTGTSSIYNTFSALNNPNSQITTSCVCSTPGTPTNVSGLATGPNSANLSWAAGSPEGSPLVTYYWVVGTIPSVTYGNGIAQGTTTGTTATTSSLSPSTTYFLRVYGVTNCDNLSSSYGTSIAFTTQISNNCSICDTKAWNTPFGDCASGHTNTDLIEWPSANIEVQQSDGYLPDDLANNPNIHANDVRPRVFGSANCDVILSYGDIIQTQNTGFRVLRQWTCLIASTGVMVNYDQTINVISQNSCSSPTMQANNILFTSVTNKQMTVNWNRGNGSRCIVKINTINSFTPPSNGSSPSANSLYTGKGEQIVYNGSSSNVTITGLSPNTTYWIRIYETNCTGTNSIYNFTTSGTNPRSQNTSTSPISGSLTVSGNLNFGIVPQGSFNDKPIILYNNTSSVIKINSLTFSPTGVFRLGIMQNGNTILPGKSLPLSIFFTPPSVGSYSSSVIINTDLPSIKATFSVTGSGVNLQPNWLGVYNELENNPELSQIFKRFRLFEIYLNDQTLVPIKICADGSKATVFKFINNNPNLNTRDVVFRIKNDENASNPDFKGRFLNTDYVYYNTDQKSVEVRFFHPKYLNVSGLFRSDAIEIVNKNNGAVLHEIPIQIYRAPVVFVHGLWGNMTNLNSIKNHFLNSGKYELKQLQLVDYKNTNASSFSENANEIKNEINSKLSELRFSLYSAGKVDLVAHSMGGILSRLYLQNVICQNGQKNDCYRNDINKLITLNTPHSGTQAANYLLNYFTPLSPCVNRVKLGLWFDKTFRGGTPRQLYDGAVKDLQCDSEAIKSLNGSSKLNKNIVPSYAISTYALFNKTYISEDGGESELIKIISDCRPGSRDLFLLSLFDNDRSDYIVPEKSQIGGLKDYSPFPDILHTKSHQKTEVKNRVLLLLEENPSASTFFDDNRNGFNPPTLQPTLFDSPDDRTISSKRSNLFIDILSPQDNTTFNVGESAEITINTIPQSENVTLIISNGYGGSKLVELNNSTAYTLSLDLNLTGAVSISALITDSEGNFEVDSVSINVLPSQLLDSLSFINDEINIPLGQTFSLSVAGFLNEQVFEMNRFPQVQYTVDNPSIIKINSPGVIEALNLGTTFIKASFQGLEAFIKVNVYEGFDWVKPNNCITPGSPTHITASVSDENITLLTWSPGDPTGSPNVRYNWVVGTDSTVTYGSGISEGTTSNTGVSTNLIPPGGTYYLRVQAYTDCDNSNSEYGTSAAFNTVPCTTPGPPVNVQALATGNTTANLSWQTGNPKGAPTLLYYWVIGTSPLVSYGNGVTQGITYSTNAVTSDLIAGTTYYLRVYATSDCNDILSPYGTSDAFTTNRNDNCITPGTPVNVHAIPTSPNTANLSWTSGAPSGSSDITYFWVIGTSPNVTYGNGLDQGFSNSTSATTSSLLCNTTYNLRVYAATNCDNSISDYGTSLAFTTSDCSCITPGNPLNVNAIPTDQNTANLSWASGTPSGSAAITYFWVIGTNPNVTYGSGVDQGFSSGPIATTSSLSCNTIYYLRVYARTNCDNSISGYGTSTAFSTMACSCSTPGTPVNLNAAVTDLNAANLSWNSGNPPGSPTVTYYWVVGTSNFVTLGNGVAQGSTTGFGATATGLLPETTYYLRVYARTSCNSSVSGYGTSYAFTTNNAGCVTPSVQSSTITFSLVSTQQFTANWFNGNGSRRVVKINTVNNFSPPANGTDPLANSKYVGNGDQVVYNGNGNSVTITGLYPNTTYWIRVYEANCSGSSSFYNTSQGTNNPISQRTRTVLPSVQSFSASNVIFNGNNIVDINPIFFTNQPYATHPPIDIFLQGNNKTRFTLNASYAEGFSFQLVDQLTIVTDGTMAISPPTYGRLSPVISTSVNSMYMDYTHPEYVNVNPYLSLKIRLLFEGGLVGMDIPVHIHAPQGALPVDLIDFQAQYNKHADMNELSWITKSEINNDYFDIERSFESFSFENIGRVAGSGNSSTTIDYVFNDKNISQDGKYTYRLKQVDLNGKATFSKPASVKVFRSQSIKTGLFPNPASDLINCFVEAHEGAIVNIDIFNSLGQKVSRNVNPEIIGNMGLIRQIDSKDFGKGIFTVVFSIDGIRYNHKLIIID